MKRGKTAAIVVTAALVLGQAIPSAAVPGSIHLVSTNGSSAFGGTFGVSSSADGSVIAIETTAPVLASDTDGFSDIYVKNVTTGVITLASPGNAGNSTSPSISADGKVVAFASGDPTFDGDSLTDVFVKELTTQAPLELISQSEVSAADPQCLCKGNANSADPSLSADGRYVAFESLATNIAPGDTDEWQDVYVVERSSDNLEHVSRGDEGNGHAGNPSISANGGVVAFENDAQNLDYGDEDTATDLYAAYLFNGQMNGLRPVSASDDGVMGFGESVDPSISDDGSAVAFASSADNFGEGDLDGVKDVYVKTLTESDVADGELVLASSPSSGAKQSDESIQPALSGDGTTVAFRSDANLGGHAFTGVDNILVKDLSTGSVSNASTSAGGDDDFTQVSTRPDVSSDGQYVTFISLASFDPNDPAGDFDAYRKDVSAATPPSCDPGAACQTTTVTVTEAPEEGVLAIVLATNTVQLFELSPGSRGETGVGEIHYENTLGNGNSWSASVAATSLVSGGNVIPFTSASMLIDPTVVAGSGTSGLPTAGTSGSFSCPAQCDSQPGTSYSVPISLVTAASTTQGTFTHANNMYALDVPLDAASGDYVGTLQYTITG